MSEPEPTYDLNNIQRLDSMELIRLRPGMFFGGRDIRALHQLPFRILEDMVDEANEGRCTHIWVWLGNHREMTIQDNRTGIPVQSYGQTETSILELMMTKTVVRLDDGTYRFLDGVMGVGIAAVNAVSTEFKAEVARDGYLWRQTYKAGKRQTDVIQVRLLEPNEETGLTITFKPDFTIFEQNDFDYKTVAARCRDIAYTTSNLTITLLDERQKKPKQEVFHFDNGMADLVDNLNRERTPLHRVIHSAREMTITPEGKNPYKGEVDVALQFTTATTYNERSYANTIQTVAGGTHVEGMRAAIRDFINAYARKMNLLGSNDADLSNRQIQKGLTAVVSVKHPHISFESQTKIRLLNPEMHSVVADVLREALEAFAAQHPDDLRRIVERCLTD